MGKEELSRIKNMLEKTVMLKVNLILPKNFSMN
jgi:hypothetical protein